MKWMGLLLLGFGLFGIVYHYGSQFLDWLRFQSLGTRDYVVERLSLMFIEVPPQRVLMFMMLGSFGLGAAAFLLFLPQVIPGLVFGILVTIVGWKAPKPVVAFIYKRRVEKLVVQLVDGLGLMSNGLKSGLSVVQAMGIVVEQMPSPLRDEFNLVLNQNKLGVPLEEAFTNLSKRVVSDDIEMFVTSVNILKETGGNLAETFDTIVSTIRERIKIEGKISAMTAQGFYQGMIIMAVPPLMGIFIYNNDPQLMSQFFSSPLGWVILGIVALLEVVAFFVIMRIVKVEV